MQEYYPVNMAKEIVEIYEKVRYGKDDRLAKKIEELRRWRELSRLSKILFD